METKLQPRTLKFAKDNKQTMNLSETRMWVILKKSPYNFRRQYVIDNFIVDFASLDHHMVIEVDGISHDIKKEYDTNREQKIIEKWFKILRFIWMVQYPDEDNIEYVWAKIHELEKSHAHIMREEV